MALIDDINALPTTVGDGQTGHLNNHQVIHAALKDHETRLGARDIVGTGSPGGRTAATVGTTYTDTAATNGAIRWIKTTGTGTTGWRVQYGETGTRDVADLLANASGTLTIFRTGNVVFMDAQGVAPTVDLSSGGTFISNMPSGFRPTMRRNFSMPSTPNGGIMRSAFQFIGGGVGVWSPTTDDQYNLHLSWYTNDTWPTTLPGTPA